MNNQVYFEINGSVERVEDIPPHVLIVFLSKVKKKTKTGFKISYKFYGITFEPQGFDCELINCRMRAAQPAIVRDYIQVAAKNDSWWRSNYHD